MENKTVKKRYLYRLQQNTQESQITEHVGTLNETVQEAIRQAQQTFPPWTKGQGPILTVWGESKDTPPLAELRL